MRRRFPCSGGSDRRYQSSGSADRRFPAVGVRTADFHAVRVRTEDVRAVAIRAGDFMQWGFGQQMGQGIDEIIADFNPKGIWIWVNY